MKETGRERLDSWAGSGKVIVRKITAYRTITGEVRSCSACAKVLSHNSYMFLVRIQPHTEPQVSHCFFFPLSQFYLFILLGDNCFTMLL